MYQLSSIILVFHISLIHIPLSCTSTLDVIVLYPDVLYHNLTHAFCLAMLLPHVFCIIPCDDHDRLFCLTGTRLPLIGRTQEVLTRSRKNLQDKVKFKDLTAASMCWQGTCSDSCGSRSTSIPSSPVSACVFSFPSLALTLCCRHEPWTLYGDFSLEVWRSGMGAKTWVDVMLVNEQVDYDIKCSVSTSHRMYPLHIWYITFTSDTSSDISPSCVTYHLHMWCIIFQPDISNWHLSIFTSDVANCSHPSSLGTIPSCSHLQMQTSPNSTCIF